MGAGRLFGTRGVKGREIHHTRADSPLVDCPSLPGGPAVLVFKSMEGSFLAVTFCRGRICRRTSPLLKS